MADLELIPERLGECREGCHCGQLPGGREVHRARSGGTFEGGGLPVPSLRVDHFTIEQDPVDVNGTRRERRSCRNEGVPGLDALRTPRGIEKDQTDGLGRLRKSRYLLPVLGEKYRFFRGERGGTYGNALCSASGEKRDGRQKDKSFRQLRPPPPWARTSGQIKGFSVSAG
jgi:hypothetical protein